MMAEQKSVDKRSMTSGHQYDLWKVPNEGLTMAVGLMENMGPWDTAAVWMGLTGEELRGFEIILWLEKPQEEDVGLIKGGKWKN